MDMEKILLELRDNLTKSLEKRDAELKEYGKVSAETVAEIKKLNKAFDDAVSDITDRVSKLEAAGNRKGLQATQEIVRKTLGQMVVESDTFKGLAGKNAKRMDAVEVKSFFKKDITSGSASAGAATDSMRVPMIISNPDRPMTIRDLLPVGTTTDSAVEYVRELLFTNNAGPQGTGATGQLQDKNKSNITFELKSAPVRTIAHYIIASRQVLDDANMLQSYIDNRLLYGLMLEEEEQILFGDGTDQNLEGITQVAEAYDPSNESQVDAVTRIDQIRLAILQARLAEFPVDAVVLNPTDWAFIELTKDGDERYIWVNVGTGAQPQLWRVAVVETTAMPEGDFLVGAFRMGAQLWDREDANIRIADQHADLFIKNGVAILAEERLALTIYRPQAFVYGTFTSTSV